jgi:hypothetical protein
MERISINNNSFQVIYIWISTPLLLQAIKAETTNADAVTQLLQMY